MSSSLVWITGAGGLIGSAILESLPKYFPETVGRPLSRQDLDLTDFPSLERLYHKESPFAVIHCAAMSSSVECNKNPDLARLVNVKVTEVLAQLAHSVPFGFLSSDLVFDGLSDKPYDETSAVNPLGLYATTKVEAEAILARHPHHLIVRTSLNGGRLAAGAKDRTFSGALRQAWKEGKTPQLFTDEYRCPIHASLTAAAVLQLLAKKKTGTFHVAGAEMLSRFEIGKLVASRHPELNPSIEPALRAEFKGEPRPARLALNISKAQVELASPLPGLTAWLSMNPSEAF